MTESEFLKLPILSPDGTDFIDIPTLWNDGTSKLEAAIYKNDLSLREMNYIPTDEKGAANGVATLGENGKVPKNQLSQDIDAMAESIAQQGKKLETYWKYLESIYDYTCDMPADKSTKPYSYTETLKEADAVKATLVTTMNADGTYTEVYTIGTNPARTRTWSKVDNQWKGVWS